MNTRKLLGAFSGFWTRYPALFVGLNLVLGSACFLSFHPSLIVPIALLWLPCLVTQKKRALLGILLFGAAFLYAHFLYPPFSMSEKTPKEATIHFSISSLKRSPSPFGQAYLYEGRGSTSFAKNLPIRLYVPINAERALADRDYLIEGKLQKKGPYNYLLKPDKTKKWIPVSKTFSLAEKRHRCKEAVRSYIEAHIQDKRSAGFVTALVTGDLDDRTLSFEFGRLGVQHILAISGFHFALLAAFCGFWLRFFLSARLSALCLLLLLSSYFFFLGLSPSVQRAWIAITLVLIGQMFNLKTSGINALGAGLAIEMACNPLFLLHIGFQLSFLCTTAILLLYPFIDQMTSTLLPKRPLSDIAPMSRLNQTGYLLSTLIRSSLALNLAVHLVSTLPVLYIFHKLPLLSMIYNLFFPFWVGLSILFFLSSSLIHLLLPPLGLVMHKASSAFTSALLHFASHPPAAFDVYVRCKTLPLSCIIVFLSLYLVIAAIIDQKRFCSVE